MIKKLQIGIILVMSITVATIAFGNQLSIIPGDKEQTKQTCASEDNVNTPPHKVCDVHCGDICCAPPLICYNNTKCIRR